jgi:hypothetical protein
MKIRLTILGLITCFCCFGQFSFEYKKYSTDKSHYIISEPYSNQEYDTLGNTTMYNSRGEIKWRIERYFAGHSTFINNNGTLLTFLTLFNDNYSNPISNYNKDGLIKTYLIEDLVDLEKGYAKLGWIYGSFFKGGIKDTIYIHSQGMIQVNSYESDSLEKIIDKRRCFTLGDSLFITTCEEKVLRLDLNNGTLKKISDNCFELFKSSGIKIDSVTIEEYETKFGREYGLPELENGKDFDLSFAEHLGFKNISTYELGTVKIKKGVRIDIHVLVDNKGQSEILRLNIENQKLEKKIKDYVSNLTFTTKYNPKNVEKAYYFDNITMDMKSKKRGK